MPEKKETSGCEKVSAYHANLYLYCVRGFVVTISQCQRKRRADVRMNSVIFRIINSFFHFVQELPEPFRTMLEVMVKFIKDQGDLRSLSPSGTDRTNQKPNSSRYHILYNNTNEPIKNEPIINAIVIDRDSLVLAYITTATNRWHNSHFSQSMRFPCGELWGSTLHF